MGSSVYHREIAFSQGEGIERALVWQVVASLAGSLKGILVYSAEVLTYAYG